MTCSEKKDAKIKLIEKLSHTRQSELVRMVVRLESKTDWLIDQLIERGACSENLNEDDGEECNKLCGCKKCWHDMASWAV